MSANTFNIPVLMYHHVNPDGDFINVRPELFEKHIRHLKDSGYTTLDTYEFLEVMEGRQLPPQKSIMITFDDGWLDNWKFAFPVLKKYNMKAVIFVVTSLVAEKGRRTRSDEGKAEVLPRHKDCEKAIAAGLHSDVMLSWDEIQEMEESGLIDIQSHTHTHQRWDKIFVDPESRKGVLKKELTTSKKIIEERQKKKCDALCWPWGKYDDDYMKIAKSSGYKMLFTTEKGTNTPADGPWKIKRLVIGNISVFNLRKKLFIHSREWLSRAYLKYS